MPYHNTSDGLLAMTVQNLGFLLDRLGQDHPPLQFLRELTQNSIEAIGRSGQAGQIIWDVDWNQFDLDGVQKLCIIDTGDGMTGDEMVHFINKLSSSFAEQSMSGNYGVGAKITAATRNPFGVLYLSWKSGSGTMIHLYRDQGTGQYGLRQWKRADGTFDHYLDIEDSVRPEAIADHGTMVVLMGRSDRDNTMTPAPETASPSRWISKYLNSRYYRLPAGITLHAREGWDYPRSDSDRNYLRTLTGQESYLADHAEASGTLPLAGAIAHWWILRDEPALTNNSGFIESSGHVAALYQDELYELTTGRSGMSRLQQFGVTFGYKQVVIYVQPESTDGRLITTNTARTLLLVNNEPLPWAEWATEFRDNLPPEIDHLVQAKAAAAAEHEHSDSIRERLKDLMNLFKISRYRPTTGGRLSIDEQFTTVGGEPADGSVRTWTGQAKPAKPGKPGGTRGNVYTLFEKKDGTPGRSARPDVFPKVRWVSVADGTREYPYIEDRAAKYHMDQNLLLINADFRVFNDIVDFFVKEYGDQVGVREVARESVHTWFEQALVEAVIGIQGLRNSKEWTQQDVEQALSEIGLTSAVMQRYHVHFAVKRELGARLGSRRAEKAS